MAKLIQVAFAIAFLAVAVQGAAVPAELEVAAKAAHAACVEETGVVEDLIEKTSEGEFTDDEKLKCYFKCILEKFTLIEDDKINFDAMLQIVPPALKETGTKMIEKCRETTGKDLCEKSYNFNKCFYQSSPETYFAV